jgi:sucrose phosphorylase
VDPVLTHLVALYGEAAGQEATAQLRKRLEAIRFAMPRPAAARQPGLALSERDALLICYGDQVSRRRQGGAVEPPLRTLADLCHHRLSGLVSGVHVLPFYPYSSDDGFSVIDYTAVDPALGTWADIASLGRHFRLMFDAVINHISAHSAWFQRWRADDPAFADFFIAVEGEPDLSRVVRPRALPLLTLVETAAGPRRVWTTFSDDQIDLNFANPAVLLAVFDVLLEYVARGAEFLRLDAIAYLWKEIGTPSIHRPQTHRVIQLIRAVLDEVAPAVVLITETNVPHVDNISYFGDGRNEAQLVYNFALPPLVLHAFHTGSARVLSAWAAGLERPSERTTYFNFLASHDGIGVNPARGILPEDEIEALVARVQAHGGLISYKHNPDGAQSPYELNINYFDALSNPRLAEPLALQVDRYAAAHAIMLALVGLPGIYFHSLLGSRGWPEGVARTGRNRTINREKLDADVLDAELEQPGHLRQRVFGRLAALLRARAASPAFSPVGYQSVLELGERVFAVRRESPDRRSQAICLHNVTALAARVQLDGRAWPVPGRAVRDLIGGARMTLDSHDRLEIELPPYGVAWPVFEQRGEETLTDA